MAEPGSDEETPDVDSPDQQAPRSPDAQAPSAKPPEDEQHRKFREALERKNAHHTAKHAEAGRNQGVREARNDKQQREFRRKSG